MSSAARSAPKSLHDHALRQIPPNLVLGRHSPVNCPCPPAAANLKCSCMYLQRDFALLIVISVSRPGSNGIKCESTVQLPLPAESVPPAAVDYACHPAGGQCILPSWTLGPYSTATIPAKCPLQCCSRRCESSAHPICPESRQYGRCPGLPCPIPAGLSRCPLEPTCARSQRSPALRELPVSRSRPPHRPLPTALRRPSALHPHPVAVSEHVPYDSGSRPPRLRSYIHFHSDTFIFVVSSGSIGSPPLCIGESAPVRAVRPDLYAQLR